MLRIVEGGLEHPHVIAMLRFHFETNIAVTPAGSAHVFDLSRLQQPDIFFLSAWSDETLMGIAALKQMNDVDGEVKSMHTLKTARRSGTGAALLEHIIAEAKKRGLKKLWLETGSFEYFAPARALYTRYGFVECGPYEGYKPDANSTFMCRDI